MKKFGTPMRAGPGVASEYVGFEGLGGRSAFFSVGVTSSAVSRTRFLARP
jgi:hypothetical protein